MPTLTDEIAEIYKILERRGDLQRAINEKEREAEEKVMLVRERIKAGESVGDRVKDFVIVHFGLAAAEIEAVFQDMERRVRAAKGEFALMVQRRQEPSMHYLIPPVGGRHFSDIVCETLCLGVLRRDSLELSLDKRACAFPTDVHVVYSNDGFGSNMALVGNHVGEGSLINFWYQSKQMILDHVRFAAVEILIGDQEVAQWASRGVTPFADLTDPKRRLRTVLKMAKMLGRPAYELPSFVAMVTARRLEIRAGLERNIAEHGHFLRQIGDYVADRRNHDEPADLKDWLRTRQEEIQKLYGEALDYGMADDAFVKSAVEILKPPSQ